MIQSYSRAVNSAFDLDITSDGPHCLDLGWVLVCCLLLCRGAGVVGHCVLLLSPRAVDYWYRTRTIVRTIKYDIVRSLPSYCSYVWSVHRTFVIKTARSMHAIPLLSSSLRRLAEPNQKRSSRSRITPTTCPPSCAGHKTGQSIETSLNKNILLSLNTLLHQFFSVNTFMMMPFTVILDARVYMLQRTQWKRDEVS